LKKTAALVSAVLVWGAAAPAAPSHHRDPPERGGRSAPEPDAANTSWLLGIERDALSSRVLEVSARFLGIPYVHSPLGEGAGVDPDPLIRFDAVDCLTFVEETLALSIAHSPAEVVPVLQLLRYERTPTYEGRNHLMEAQWLPNNVRKGFLRDVTRAFGGAATVRARKVISARSWASPSSRLLNLPEERHATGVFELDMVPLAAAWARVGHIPSGTILLVIRDEQPRRVTRITHLGFVIQRQGRTFLRHAARSVYRRVVDEDLSVFLARNAKYGKWPVSGIALFEPQAPSLPEAERVLSTVVSDMGPP
jgi:Protein of unknown function (DUF1460)